jgi:hypothetical protein
VRLSAQAQAGDLPRRGELECPLEEALAQRVVLTTRELRCQARCRARHFESGLVASRTGQHLERFDDDLRRPPGALIVEEELEQVIDEPE